jgi:CheY-like chemotaxis protein
MSWSPPITPSRPRMLLAYADPAFASPCARLFRRLGWEVHMAAGASEVQRLVDQHAPQVAVLDVDLPEESGWLTSAKLTLTHPGLRVILLAGDRSETLGERAATVGAAGVVTRPDGAEALVRTVYAATHAQAV